MVYERSGHTATRLKDGRVLIAGGGDSAAAQSSAELYGEGGAGGVNVALAVDVAVDANSRRYVLHTDPEGRAILSTINASGEQESRVSFGPYSGWMPRAIAATPDGRTRLLWTHGDGQVSVWFLSASGVVKRPASSPAPSAAGLRWM